MNTGLAKLIKKHSYCYNERTYVAHRVGTSQNQELIKFILLTSITTAFSLVS